MSSTSTNVPFVTKIEIGPLIVTDPPYTHPVILYWSDNTKQFLRLDPQNIICHYDKFLTESQRNHFIHYIATESQTLISKAKNSPILENCTPTTATSKNIIFIELDTIANYHAKVEERLLQQKFEMWTSSKFMPEFWKQAKTYHNKYLQKVISDIDCEDGFYYNLDPFDGAIECLKKLHSLGFRIYFMSTPNPDSRTCHSDKYRWIQKHFGQEWCSKLILTPEKRFINPENETCLFIDDQITPFYSKTKIQMQILKKNLYNTEKELSNTPSFILSFSDWKFETVVELMQKCFDETISLKH